MGWCVYICRKKKHVVYGGWKAGMLYIRSVYGVN